ncbi:MAG: SRPBCC domain-containing protein [Chloroflexi bacterium]|nr:SRPBCC domain-containing protein [Chloroflexota bacterium]
MKSFSVTTNIKASPETVWKILTDASRWLEWNTTVDKIEGKIVPGEKVTVWVKINPGRAFPLKVTEFTPPQRMVWADGMPFGLFRGARTYTLTKQADGSVDFAMREDYTGLMAPMITGSIPDLQPAFDEFAAALKKRAESEK